MISANVCLDPNARSNYGTLAQHVMDEHIISHVVGVPQLFPCRPWCVHTWRKTLIAPPWLSLGGQAWSVKRQQASQQATRLRSVEQSEHDDESRALQLSYRPLLSTWCENYPAV